MAKATGARSELTYVPETTWGTTPSTEGTAAGATTDAAGYALGATSIDLASAGTGTIVAADFITFAGDAAEYEVVTGDADVSDAGTIVIKAPGLTTAITTAATAITIVSAPAMKIIPRTGGAPILAKESFQSADIRSDRQVADMRHGFRSASLSLPVEMRHTEYDSILESLMYSTWAANVLKIGVIEKSFTFESGFLDIAQYGVMTGGVVNGLSMSVTPDGIVTGTFELMGKDLSYSGTPLDASPAAAGTSEPFDSLTGTINEGGSPIAIVTGLDFSIENSIEAPKVVGSNSASELIEGQAVVTGTVTAYFEDATLLDKFANETSSSIDVTLTDPAAQTLKFDFGNVLYTGGELDVGGTGPITVSLPFTALYDVADASTLVITRSA